MSPTRPMLAARRLTEPCTRTTAMMQNVSVAAARNTSTPTRVALPSFSSRSSVPIDQILKLTMRNMMKLPISIQPPAAARQILVRSSCQTLA